jgi:ATP-binding cassette subfamily F protein uup
LQIAYFDQLRDQLKEDQTVLDNIADGYDTVRVAGGSKHIVGYAQDFLFTPERARMQIRYLSGGERTRVLLARLFAKPANVIVLDEPTNDLDTETLELLEELLVDYAGTVLMVSHDRTFLNNVVTSTIVFEDGGVREYFGGYDDWQQQRSQRLAEDASAQARAREKSKVSPQRRQRPASAATQQRLSYNEQRELAALPERIEHLEREISALHETMATAEFYQRPGAEISSETEKLRDLERELESAYARWEHLDERDR